MATEAAEEAAAEVEEEAQATAVAESDGREKRTGRGRLTSQQKSEHAREDAIAVEQEWLQNRRQNWRQNRHWRRQRGPGEEPMMRCQVQVVRRCCCPLHTGACGPAREARESASQCDNRAQQRRRDCTPASAAAAAESGERTRVGSERATKSPTPSCPVRQRAQTSQRHRKVSDKEADVRSPHHGQTRCCGRLTVCIVTPREHAPAVRASHAVLPATLHLDHIVIWQPEHERATGHIAHALMSSEEAGAEAREAVADRRTPSCLDRLSPHA